MGEASPFTHQLWDIQFINQIIASMAEGVFTLDTEGRISLWNPAMERISGYNAEEALGRSCQLLQCSRCFGRDCPASLQKCRILKKGRSEAKECLLRHRDGHDVPVIKTASVVRDTEGTILGVVETVTDLTELHRARQRAEEATLRLGEVHSLHNIIGKSRAMRQVFAAVRAAAASEATILIEGESGTGKELVAGAIHYNGSRKKAPLVTVNCAALSETLLESELFGHVRGAFTGAVRDRPGRFEEARGGTIFLDEIGELSPMIQVKLLRVLQEREIERVGESRKRPVNARFITATNRDLMGRVREGYFREDLFYRLKVFPIHLPPLLERKEDIPLLSSHFIRSMNEKTGKQIQGMSQAAMRIFMDYHWPGNVRELENSIEHGFVLCNEGLIELRDLPLEIRRADPLPVADSAAAVVGTMQRRSPRHLTEESLRQLLADCDWNKAEVARRVGLSRTAIWKYMKKWDIPLKKEGP